MFGHTEPFDEQYHCYSGAFADKPQLEGGDKILLPASAFEQLARFQISYPMLFELRTQSGEGRTAACSSSRPRKGTSICPTG